MNANDINIHSNYKHIAHTLIFELSWEFWCTCHETTKTKMHWYDFSLELELCLKLIFRVEHMCVFELIWNEILFQLNAKLIFNVHLLLCIFSPLCVMRIYWTKWIGNMFTMQIYICVYVASLLALHVIYVERFFVYF